MVPVVPGSTSVSPPPLDLIILHPDNCLLPITFTILKDCAVSRKARGPQLFNLFCTFDAKIRSLILRFELIKSIMVY